MSGPISPGDVAGRKTSSIPEQVFEAFNTLIVKRWSGNSAVVRQDEAVKAIMALMPVVTRSDVFTESWLDVEAAYRRAGWNVEYDKPGYNESYEATFTFSRKKSRP